MDSFELRRLGVLMEPEPGNAREVEGVLNPAVVRGPDRELYIFPRLTARGNYSRIGIARVQFNAAGDPIGVERIGVALEPEADYELRPGGGGGCEDPRITFVEPLDRYVMACIFVVQVAHVDAVITAQSREAETLPVEEILRLSESDARPSGRKSGVGPGFPTRLR